MKLLTTALVIVFLSTTASAKPIGSRRHHDADIADDDLIQSRLEGNTRRSRGSSDSSSNEDSSSESSQSLESRESSESSGSQSSEESFEESSEEVKDLTTTAVTTTAMTTVTTVEGSTPIPGGKTPPPVTPTRPIVATSTGDVIDCVTVDVPTSAPITENRGDN